MKLNFGFVQAGADAASSGLGVVGGAISKAVPVPALHDLSADAVKARPPPAPIPAKNTALQNLLSASKCHKFSFAFASPVSCIVLIAIAALTASTRNYFTGILTTIADDVGKLQCVSPDISAKARQSILDAVNNNPTFVQADVLFKNYITAFGGAIIAFHIVVIQLFHCCSILKRSKIAHVCGVTFVTIGALLFFIAGYVIM
jgi:hypothetical protein